MLLTYNTPSFSFTSLHSLHSQLVFSVVTHQSTHGIAWCKLTKPLRFLRLNVNSCINTSVILPPQASLSKQYKPTIGKKDLHWFHSSLATTLTQRRKTRISQVTHCHQSEKGLELPGQEESVRALTAKHISVLVVLPFLSLLFILNSSNMLGRGTAHSLIRSASAGLNCKSSLQTRGHFSSSLFKHKGNPLRRCVGHSVCTCKKRKLDEKGRLRAWYCSMLGGGLHSPIPHSA